MSKCVACEHPVIIPEEMRGRVTEIHTCKSEREPYCDHGPFDACRCLLNDPFSDTATSPLSVTPGVTPDHQAAARRVTFRPAPAWADTRDEHDEEL